MENSGDLGRGSDGSASIPKSDSKILGEKRISSKLVQERELGPRKRVKMRDLQSVCRSGGISTHHTTSLENKESNDQFQSGDVEMSQVTEVPITLDLVASQAGQAWSKTFPVAVNPASRPLDLNTDVRILKNKDKEGSKECAESSEKITLLRDHSNFVNVKGTGLDLNAEDVPVSENLNPFYPYKTDNYVKPRAASECGSCTGPLEEKDSMTRWKEMKQNGFLSSTHGGIPVPKQRTKKSKNEEMRCSQPKRKNEETKKKMERAKREQVDRFAKIAAPSGLLNELNPGIINHVRNRKQVRSIIESLVRLERLENDRVANMQATHQKSGTCAIGNVKDSGLRFCHENWTSNTLYEGRQTRGFPVLMNKSSLLPEDKGGDGERTRIERFSGKSFASNSTLENEEDTLALKLSSLTRVPEDDSPLSNEESATYLSIKAATIASQWLGLILQDIKGRLAALRRSRKRVRDVITTDLPSLISKEFSSNQENDPCITKNSSLGFSSRSIADMHRARWNLLFERMDKALSEEEDQLESWSNQVKEMQIHCDQGLQIVQWNTASGIPQWGMCENDSSSHTMDNSDREIAVRAAAASIYSTCNFLLSTNVPCF